MSSILFGFSIFVGVWFTIIFVGKMIRNDEIHNIIPVIMAAAWTAVITRVIGVW